MSKEITTPAAVKQVEIKDLQKADSHYASIDELTQYRTTLDPKLPDDEKLIDNSLLLKFAARLGEKKGYAVVYFTHGKAKTHKNNYEPRMLLVDSTRVKINVHDTIVGKESIGVNGFVAVKPLLRQQVMKQLATTT